MQLELQRQQLLCDRQQFQRDQLKAAEVRSLQSPTLQPQTPLQLPPILRAPPLPHRSPPTVKSPKSVSTSGDDKQIGSQNVEKPAEPVEQDQSTGTSSEEAVKPADPVNPVAEGEESKTNSDKAAEGKVVEMEATEQGDGGEKEQSADSGVKQGSEGGESARAGDKTTDSQGNKRR